MSAIPGLVPTISAWSECDEKRTLHALQQVFDDLDWAEPEIRLRLHQLVEELRQRGLGRALSVALIEDCLARKILRAAASFVDLTTFVRLDGCQTGTIHAEPFSQQHAAQLVSSRCQSTSARRAPPRSRVCGAGRASAAMDYARRRSFFRSRRAWNSAAMALAGAFSLRAPCVFLGAAYLVGSAPPGPRWSTRRGSGETPD
jgi:hypothetical protein